MQLSYNEKQYIIDSLRSEKGYYSAPDHEGIYKEINALLERFEKLIEKTNEKFLVGQLVVVYDSWIGRVTKHCSDGVYVQPLIENTTTHHSCYAEHNVKECEVNA